MAVISKDLGAVTAYAAAVNRGYTGTKEEFETLMASYATVAQQAAESAQSAEQSAQSASGSATDAQTAQGTAQQAATDAQTAQASAQGYAQSAQQSAQSASQYAQSAESAKDTAVDAVDGFASGAQQALDGVNQAGNNWKSLAQAKALDSEAYAIGTRDGEDVGTQDETYHNNAKWYAQQGSTSAQTASDAAQTATTKAGEAQASASAAAESARTLTIDATLTQSGQAADSKVVGDAVEEIKDEANNCLQIEEIWKESEFALSTDKLRNNTTFEETTSSSFNNTVISVEEGEQYKISGWSNQAEYAPAYWSDSELIAVIPVQRGAFTEYKTVAPSGATKMMINGRTTIPIVVTRNLQTEKSAKFIKELVRQHLGVQRTETDQINVFMSGYDENVDLECRFTRKSGNNLPDIQGWYRCVNTGAKVLTASDGTEESILKSSSDFLGPSVVYAVNNMDGDFPTLTDRKLTGGWHMYDSMTSGDYSATARNVSLDIKCDGKSIAQGEQARGDEVVITIVNRLQASNTEKADGTGREVAELTYRITFRDDFRADVYGTIKALEEIHYAEFIGISAYLMSGQPFRWVGSRVNRQPIVPSASAQRSGDKNCTSILQTGVTDVFEIAIDPTYDLGTMYANQWSNSFTSSSNKGYANYINQDAQRTDGSRLALNADDMVHWHGYYNFCSI